ncbi:UNVERIFIED_CONTAM: hypothetical protein Slati_0520500 [Sesamum latifolium]|uniref:CCHC-type domain-containing protein n=1 Tax=Sesamum latifolium TaxID=2727402 RepID=A0AAW2XZ86_9LAMI
MEDQLERLGRSLVLTEEEEGGLTLTQEVWTGDGRVEGFLVVGRLLTPRPYRFDVLRMTLTNILHPVRGLALKLLADNRDVVEAIGARLGTVIHVPAQSLLGWESKIRVNVSLDVRKPIKQGLRLQSPSGEELMVLFTYEKLPTFCYGCGVLGHILRDCASRLEELERGEGRGELQYGAWF